MSHTTRPAARAAVPLLALTLALGACGAGEPSEPAAPTSSAETSASASPTATSAAPKPVRPKGAKVVKGTGYSFAMPKGWKDLTRKMRRDQPSLDVAVGNTVQTDGFTSNLAVTLTPTRGATTDTIDDVAEQILASVRKRAPRYAIRPHTEVAGVPAAHLSGIYRSGKQRYWLEQFVVIGDQQTMVISFSLAPSIKPKPRTTLIDRVLKSWAIAS